MDELIPPPSVLEERVPENCRRFAGIGPYYLPVFGRMYLKRLRDCVAAVQRHAQDPASVLDAGCGEGGPCP